MLRRLCFIHSRERLCSAPLLSTSIVNKWPFIFTFLIFKWKMFLSTFFRWTEMPPRDFFKTWTILSRADLCKKTYYANTYTNVNTLCKYTNTHSLSLARAHFIRTHKHSHVNSHECCILQLILKHYILYQTTQLTTQYHSDMKQRRWRILKGAIRRVKGQRAG